MQQWNLLRRNGEKDPSPRKSFCADLNAFLTPLQAAGDKLLVMGEINEQLGDSTSGMNAVVAKFGLVNSTAYHHDVEGDVATYSRSNNRLDYIVCTYAWFRRFGDVVSSHSTSSSLPTIVVSSLKSTLTNSSSAATLLL
jgi:hypothetical protein